MTWWLTFLRNIRTDTYNTGLYFVYATDIDSSQKIQNTNNFIIGKAAVGFNINESTLIGHNNKAATNAFYSTIIGYDNNILKGGYCVLIGDHL